MTGHRTDRRRRPHGHSRARRPSSDGSHPDVSHVRCFAQTDRTQSAVQLADHRSQRRRTECWRGNRSSSNSATGSLATSWIWTATWLDAYGDEIEHWFVVAESGGNGPVGIALLTRGHGQRRGPLADSHHPPRHGRRSARRRRLDRIQPPPRSSPDVAPSLSHALVERARSPPLAGADVLQLDGFAPEELVGLLRGPSAREPTDLLHLRHSTQPWRSDRLVRSGNPAQAPQRHQALHRTFRCPCGRMDRGYGPRRRGPGRTDHPASTALDQRPANRAHSPVLASVPSTTN